MVKNHALRPSWLRGPLNDLGQRRAIVTVRSRGAG